MGTPLQKGQRFNPYRLFIGMFLPNIVARTRLISPTDKLVWARLCQFAGENGLCFPSFRRIAFEIGISRSGAIKSVNSLVEKGFLEKHVPDDVELGNQKTNHYYFLWHPVFDEAFEAPSTQSVPGASSQAGPSTQSEPALVHSVDLPSLQSAPKENHKENQKNTTTTTSSHSPDVSEQMVGGEDGCSGFSLSDIQHYIDLKVQRTQEEGAIKKSPTRLRRTLARLAQSGELGMSDFQDLKRSSQARGSLGGDVLSGGKNLQHEKEQLHKELSEFNLESKAWWEQLAIDHPAKKETKPLYIPEDMWIRQQFKKYGVENDQSK